jgi:hypothetical protein
MSFLRGRFRRELRRYAVVIGIEHITVVLPAIPTGRGVILGAIMRGHEDGTCSLPRTV